MRVMIVDRGPPVVLHEIIETIRCQMAGCGRIERRDRMWLFTRYGFYSISVMTGSEKTCIRARRNGHLQALHDRFARLRRCEITISEASDYRYRMLVPRRAWESAMLELVREQTWSNFKNEVARFNGCDDYERALHSVWAIMREVQAKGERDVRKLSGRPRTRR